MNRIKYFFIASFIFYFSNMDASFVSLAAPEEIQQCNGYLKYHSPEQIANYLEYVENINQKNSSGDTLLHKNICSRNLPLIQSLLQAGALFTIQNKLGQTALYKIIMLEENENQSIEVLNLCMQYSNLNILADEQGKTLIHIAAAYKRNKVLDFLCSYCREHLEKRGMAYINTFDNAGYTAINECITYSNNVGLAILLTHGANPNKTKYSFTPLFEAVRQQRTEAVRILLNDPRTHYNSRKKFGYLQVTPLDYARLTDGKIKMIKLLEARNIKK